MATRSLALVGAVPAQELADADTLPMEVDPPAASFEDEPTVAYEQQPGPAATGDIVRVMSPDGKRMLALGEVRRVRGNKARVRNQADWIELRLLQVIIRKADRQRKGIRS